MPNNFTKKLDVSENRLTDLNGIPEKLQILKIDNNPIDALGKVYRFTSWKCRILDSIKKIFFNFNLI